VMIEGGSVILKEFIRKGLWDEGRVFVSGQRFGNGIEAPAMVQLGDRAEELLGDRLYYYRNE
jgi:diaminohydroxyphosphoribosylaminopyrimidine deaminase / 5-amino-6-(5-phosphoribosylamino)uracil reductase